MAAFDFQWVQKARIIADEQRARNGKLRQSLQATFDDGARAIGDPLATLQHRRDLGVGFPALEFVERGQVWIRVGQIDNQSQRHLIVR